MFKFNKFPRLSRGFSIKSESGQASRLLLVLAIVVLVAVIIVYLVMRMAEKPPSPTVPVTQTVPLPVYEQTMDNIRFVFESAINWGSVLKASNIPNHSDSQKDLSIINPGAKFIQVTIGAQNVGKENTGSNVWDIENIVDSQGRNFVPSGGEVKPWLPKLNYCGTVLTPAFDPSPCTKIYEVSKQSTGMKIRVTVKSGNKKDTFLLDLIVK